MKKQSFFGAVALLFVIIGNAQSYFENFPDQYNEDLTDYTFDIFYESGNGEYQLVIGEFPWGWDNQTPNNNDDNGPFFSYPKSMKIELVSFPFVPECLPNCFQAGTTGHVREFITVPLDDYGFVSLSRTGNGTTVEGTGIGIDGTDYQIFLKTNIHLLGLSYKEGINTSLMSLDYLSNCSNGSMLLPHSIFKYTLYIHEHEDYNEENLMDSVSWIVDNTRGRMKSYPFYNYNHDVGISSKSYYDVAVFPQMQHRLNIWNPHLYLSDSNEGWYDSPEQDYNNGSIDFFPDSDIDNSPYLFPHPLYEIFYPEIPPDPGYFNTSEFIHPPQYGIVNPTIRNNTGEAYAGYGSQADNGIEHDYFIQESFPLDLINPEEKIIYNPSVCTVNTVITFPENYKFLSVHGRPVDKTTVEYYKNVYWPDRGFYFDDNREVPVPYVDEIPPSEYYIEEGKEIIIEPNVIIMNANFTGPESGKGKLSYWPDLTYGNFNISSDLILGIRNDLYYITDLSTTWEDYDYHLQGSYVYIEHGATLTIKSTIYASSKTNIIVKPGGKLIIDGGMITGYKDQMWQGIQVWGTASAGQNLEDQGWVEVINEGTIRNANIGIQTIKVINDGGESYVDYDFTGGIIQAINANFINNRIAVHFYDYEYNSQSGFVDCDFITDDDYLGTTNPDYFVKMNEVNGIGFTYCRFANDNDQDCYGNGIYSFNSGFNVNGKCLSGQQPCSSWANGEFTNLGRGIYATSGGSLYFPEVDHITFTGNNRSVYFSAMENGTITNCTITTGPTSGYDWPYGIYLDHSTGYTIENNEFFQGQDVGIGMVVNNSGGEPNQIYRNYFEGLVFGIMAQQENRSRNGTGLILKCNEYTGNEYDQVVTWDGQFLTPIAGIAREQGADISLPNAPAGNRFSHTGPTMEDATDIYNEASDIIYFYHIEDPIWHLEPYYYTDETVAPIPNTYPQAYWDPDESCPPSEESGGRGPDGDIGEIRSTMSTSQQKTDSVQNIINILKDGGDTEELKTEVVLSSPPESWTLYYELMNNSPYISDTVMQAAIEKENVLPSVMIRDVMVANPHNAKDDALMDKIEERAIPMPDYMKAQILQGGSLVSAYESLQSQLAWYRQNRKLAYNLLTKHYLIDTINPTASADTLMDLYENEKSLIAKYNLAMLNARLGEWNEGLIVLNSVPSQFELSMEESEELTQITTFYGLLSELDQQGKTIVESDSSQLETLFDIKGTQSGIASDYARNVLLALGEITYMEPIILPDFTKSAVAHKEYEDIMKALDEHHYLHVFPNPAVDFVIVEHELERKPKDALVKIRNSKGEIIINIRVIGKKNQNTVNVTGLKPGVYVATLFVNGKEVESIKFTKVI